MSEETNAKRTEWSVQPDQASHGKRLCIMRGDEIVAVTIGSKPRDKRDANKIVRAVNAHDALVEVVRAWQESSDLIYELNTRIDGQRKREIENRLDVIADEMAFKRPAALALAEARVVITEVVK